MSPNPITFCFILKHVLNNNSGRKGGKNCCDREKSYQAKGRIVECWCLFLFLFNFLFLLLWQTSQKTGYHWAKSFSLINTLNTEMESPCSYDQWVLQFVWCAMTCMGGVSSSSHQRHFCGTANVWSFIAHTFYSVHSCPALWSSLSKKPLITVYLLRLKYKTVWKIRTACRQNNCF